MADRIWILTNSALAAILGNTSATDVVDVAGNTVYEINKLTDTPNTLSHATHKNLLVVNDYETVLSDGTGVYYGLMAEIEAGLPSDYSSIMYDNENWALDAANGFIPQTRTMQQANAINWYKRAGDLIRCYGYTAIGAPARDLATVLWTPAGGDDAQTISSGILGAAAPFYDIIHIQAQDDQPTAAESYALPATAFNNLVQEAVQQIQGTSPSAVITCGLAVHAEDVSPYTKMQTMQQTTAEYAVSQGCVGFWMNFNSNNAAGIAAVQALAGL